MRDNALQAKWWPLEGCRDLAWAVVLALRRLKIISWNRKGLRYARFGEKTGVWLHRDSVNVDAV